MTVGRSRYEYVSEFEPTGWNAADKIAIDSQGNIGVAPINTT